MFTLDELTQATEIVRRHVPPTPQYCWPLLCEAVGREVWVKHENHTPVGAFKVRGGLVFADRLRRRRTDVRGLICATTGNHGQSVAYAGRAAGLPVTIVVPYGNNPAKNAAMRGFGATLVEHGHDFQAALEHARELAVAQALEIVPPYHPDLIVGVATYAKELFDAVADLETVYVPIGMGSGISGLIGVRDLLGLPTELVGAVSTEAPAMARSFQEGEAVSTESVRTFVDGVACRVPDPAAVATIVAGAARVIEVPEDATADAMRLMIATTHNVPEPAGAIALAALRTDPAAGKRVAVIQSGGNVADVMLRDVIGGITPSAPSSESVPSTVAADSTTPR